MILELLVIALASSSPSELESWLHGSSATIVDGADLDSDVQNAAPKNPGVVRGNFGGKGEEAVVLRKGTDCLTLDAIQCAPNCEWTTLEALGNDYKGIAFLRKAPAGKKYSSTPAADKQESVTLHNDGVIVEYFEKAAVLYYRSKGTGKWTTMPIAD